MGVLLCNAPSSDLRWLRTGARVAVKAFKIDVATLACSTEVARMPDVVEAEPAGSGDVPGFETVGDDTLRLACFFGLDKLWSIQREDVAEVWFFILRLNKSQTYLDIVVRCKGSFLRSLAASTGAGFDHAS